MLRVAERGLPVLVVAAAVGCAVFLGDDSKTFVIYVDHAIGNVIQLTLDGVKKERPLTHDLIGSIMLGLDTKLDHIVVNDAREVVKTGDIVKVKVLEADEKAFAWNLTRYVTKRHELECADDKELAWKRFYQKHARCDEAKGGDWSTENIVGAADVKARGGSVHSIPFIHDRSTTATLRRIRG